MAEEAEVQDAAPDMEEWRRMARRTIRENRAVFDELVNR